MTRAELAALLRPVLPDLRGSTRVSGLAARAEVWRDPEAQA